MENSFFLITGTSKGIGDALAQNILKKGGTVLGVARGRSAALKSTQYHHLTIDLADASQRTNRIHFEAKPKFESGWRNWRHMISS